MYWFILIFLVSNTLSNSLFSETSVERDGKKADFLKAPIFKNRRDSLGNSQQWNKREQDAGSKFEHSEPLPLSTNKKTLNLARPTSLSSNWVKSSMKTVSKIAPNTLPQYSQLPKPNSVEDASECGYNSYTLNYCLYLSHKPKPLICSEKWNRCLEGYQP